MKEELKVGDIVEGFGFSDIKWAFWEKIYYPCKWKLQELKYYLRKKWQTLKSGYPDEEVFEFYSCAIKYSLPRLKRFRKDLQSHPANMKIEEWEVILDKIIWSMEHHDDDISPIYPENYDSGNVIIEISERGTVFKNVDDRKLDCSLVYAHGEKIQEGFELFGKYFTHLWN